MLLPFHFNEIDHLYTSPGYDVMSTSQVLSLAGLVDYGAVPSAVLANAAWRGTQLHRAVEFVETAVHAGSSLQNAAADMARQLVGPLAEIRPYLIAYLKCRQDYQLEPIPPQEWQAVYLHNDVAVGCTIDMRCRIHGRGYQGIPAIGDLKTNARQSGKALQQKKFSWRMQTASYAEATNYDQNFWSHFGDSVNECSRFICQVAKDGSYEFHCFREHDDARAWDACVTVAAAKLANGHKLDNEKAA